jgi:hypothetical protein
LFPGGQLGFRRIEARTVVMSGFGDARPGWQHRAVFDNRLAGATTGGRIGWVMPTRYSSASLIDSSSDSRDHGHPRSVADLDLPVLSERPSPA